MTPRTLGTGTVLYFLRCSFHTLLSKTSTSVSLLSRSPSEMSQVMSTNGDFGYQHDQQLVGPPPPPPNGHHHHPDNNGPPYLPNGHRTSQLMGPPGYPGSSNGGHPNGPPVGAFPAGGGGPPLKPNVPFSLPKHSPGHLPDEPEIQTIRKLAVAITLSVLPYWFLIELYW